jgi:hypothetical protein
MIQDFNNLKVSLDNKLRNRKSLVYLINTYRFQRLFENADECTQAKLLDLIKEEKPKEIRNWIKKQVGEENLTELRLQAKKYLVKNYGRLSRKELIKALEVFNV